MTNKQEWAGAVGDVWAQEWRRTDRSFAPLTDQLVAAVAEIAPDTGHAVDIGCGAGETALRLAEAKPDLSVTGIDLSPDLIAVARERGAGRDNPVFVADDAIAGVSALAPVDLFLSRHGVMFFDDPVTAFTAFRAAAAPGAPIVFSCFRDWSLNAFAHEIGALVGETAPLAISPGPFAFADEGRVRDILTQAGWRDAAADPVDFGYVTGAGEDPVADAVGFLSRIGPAARALRVAPEGERPAILARLTQICERYRQGDTVSFPTAAWIWTAYA